MRKYKNEETMIKTKSILIVLTVFLNFLNSSCSPHYGGDPPPALPAFFLAVEENDIEEVKKLASVKKCSSFDPKENWDTNRSAFEGECFDANVKSWNGKTALFHVKSLEMAEYLVSQGAIVKVQDRYGYTPLHFAHTPAVAKFFLERGIDIEVKNEDKETSLFTAVEEERIETAKFLFQQGANPHAKTKLGGTPLSEAESQSKWHTFKLNKLIKLFKSYTPPEPAKTENQDTDKSEL